MHFALMAFIGTLLAAVVPVSPEEVPSNSVTIPSCLIKLKNDVEVSAEEAGILDKILVKEGDQVAEGDLLAQLDDTQARVVEEVSRYKLEVAQTEAGNDINVRFATAAAKVSKAELESAYAANRQAPGTVPQTELNRLHLTLEQYTLQIEQSQHDLGIAKVTVKVREAELKAAIEGVKRRKITAPVAGVVVNLYQRDEGEWVQPGDPVMRLVRMDRLRVEGFLNAIQYSPSDVDGQPVAVTVPLPHGRETFTGKVTHVSPIVEAGPEFMVWAEVDNRLTPDGHWALRPGLTAEMTIRLK